MDALEHVVAVELGSMAGDAQPETRAVRRAMLSSALTCDRNQPLSGMLRGATRAARDR